MKRIALGILVLIFCGSFALAREEVAGTWYLTEGETESVRLSAREVGLEMTLTLNADGAMTLTGTDMDDITGTWSLQQDTLYLYHDDGDISRMQYENGRLSIEDGGVIMYFDRAIQTEQTTGLTVRSDVELSDFAGPWEGVSIAEEGRSVPLGVLGARLTLQIRKDQVDMTMVLGGEKTGDTLTARLQEGSLIVENEDMTISLRLLENGLMVCSWEDVTLFLSRQEASEASPVLTDAVLSDFDGRWTAVYGVSQGVQVPMADMQAAMHLSISDGRVTVSVDSAEGSSQTTIRGTIANGTLTIIDVVEGSIMDLRLHENGLLSCTMRDTPVYFEKDS